MSGDQATLNPGACASVIRRRRGCHADVAHPVGIAYKTRPSGSPEEKDSSDNGDSCASNGRAVNEDGATTVGGTIDMI